MKGLRQSYLHSGLNALVRRVAPRGQKHPSLERRTDLHRNYDSSYYTAMKTLTALTLRKQLGAILDEVAESGAPILITRGNRPLAMLVAPDEYEALLGGRERRLGLAAKRVAEWRAEYIAGAPAKDTAALVRNDRDNRR